MITEIREATERDLKMVYQLLREFSVFIKTPEKFTITLDDFISHKNIYRCVVVIDDNKIVGFATYFNVFYSWSGKAIYLDDLYVLETYRGKGIGTKLITKVIEAAKVEKCVKIKWQVSKWNSKAIEFYKSIGANIDKVEINCDLNIKH